jgi:Mor family transcriptional regulator
MGIKQEGKESFKQVLERLRKDFGKETAKKVARCLVEEMGGIRLSFPTFEDLGRWERNERIRAGFNGANILELAGRFSLSPTQVRRIVSRGSF